MPQLPLDLLPAILFHIDHNSINYTHYSALRTATLSSLSLANHTLSDAARRARFSAVCLTPGCYPMAVGGERQRMVCLSTLVPPNSLDTEPYDAEMDRERTLLSLLLSHWSVNVDGDGANAESRLTPMYTLVRQLRIHGHQRHCDATTAAVSFVQDPVHVDICFRALARLPDWNLTSLKLSKVSLTMDHLCALFSHSLSNLNALAFDSCAFPSLDVLRTHSSSLVPLTNLEKLDLAFSDDQEFLFRTCTARIREPYYPSHDALETIYILRYHLNFPRLEQFELYNSCTNGLVNLFLQPAGERTRMALKKLVLRPIDYSTLYSIPWNQSLPFLTELVVSVPMTLAFRARNLDPTTPVTPLQPPTLPYLKRICAPARVLEHFARCPAVTEVHIGCEVQWSREFPYRLVSPAIIPSVPSSITSLTISANSNIVYKSDLQALFPSLRTLCLTEVKALRLLRLAKSYYHRHQNSLSITTLVLRTNKSLDNPDNILYNSVIPVPPLMMKTDTYRFSNDIPDVVLSRKVERAMPRLETVVVQVYPFDHTWQRGVGVRWRRGSGGGGARESDDDPGTKRDWTWIFDERWEVEVDERRLAFSF
jgi:hypothetical protein